MEVVRKVVIPLAGGDDLVPAYAQERPVVLVVKLFLLFLQAVDERGTHVLAEGWVAGLPDLKPKHLHQLAKGGPARHLLAAQSRGAVVRPVQIGRASWRERGGRYV